MSTWLMILAVMADLAIGDPIYQLHPVRLIGGLALSLEAPSRAIFKNATTAGFITALLTICSATVITYLVTATLTKLSLPLGFIACIYFTYSSIACKDMINHSRKIFNYLQDNNLLLARVATSMIVGRETKHMDKEEVIRATVESIAENTVDGTLAPLFYAFIGGLCFGIEGAASCAILYRTVNTLDSSFGYRNERYQNFGMISARIDDLFNFIPARLSLFAISLAAPLSGLNGVRAFKVGIRDHSNHESPNSGYSEAAFAGALGLKFGGDTLYHGKIIKRPELGDMTKKFSLDDITAACNLLFNSVLLTTLIFSLLLFLFNK